MKTKQYILIEKLCKVCGKPLDKKGKCPNK